MLKRIALVGIVCLGVIIASCTSAAEDEPPPPEAAATEEQTEPDTAPAPDEEDRPETPPPPAEEPVEPKPDPEPDEELPARPAEPQAGDDRETVTVLRVIDGDTIEVRLASGNVDTVRYIGIDTPETVAPGRPVEECGPEASQRNADLLSGGTVQLERDITERDRFSRLLRYVYVVTASREPVFINEELVRAGLAVVSTFPPDVKHVDRFIAAQNAAQADELCVWEPAPVPAPPPSPPRDCDQSYPDVCIPVGAADYDCAGGSGNGPNYISGPIRVLRPDPHRLDRDGNGIGCE